MKNYAIKEVFDTLQGEGSRAGGRSVFLRFAGCNLWDGLPENRVHGKGACARWCDTSFAQGEKQTAEQILARLESCWPKRNNDERWVVISGGEPLLQLDEALAQSIKDAGWKIALETNGSVPAKDGVLYAISLLTVSPKRHGGLVLSRADELKVVLPGDTEKPWTDDELNALDMQLCPSHLYVQPQDPIDSTRVQASYLHNNAESHGLSAQYQANVDRCLAFVSAHPAWRVSIQTHKLINIP